MPKARARTSSAHDSLLNRGPVTFGRGNAKLDDGIWTFSLPAGYSCPFAAACLSRADRHTGRIKDGRATEFRCYAASQESRWRTVRDSRWRNLQSVRSCKTQEELTQLLLDSLTPFAGLVRLHDSGDFLNQSYLDAWLDVARRRPRTVLYAYTKALPLWVARLDEVGTGYEPGEVENFILTASYGGTHDYLIEAYGLRYARVVFSREEAVELGLALDHDDSLAYRHGPSFALLIHGTQPAGTEAAKAVAALRARGDFGYGERADAIRRELFGITSR